MKSDRGVRAPGALCLTVFLVACGTDGGADDDFGPGDVLSDLGLHDLGITDVATPMDLSAEVVPDPGTQDPGGSDMPGPMDLGDDEASDQGSQDPGWTDPGPDPGGSDAPKELAHDMGGETTPVCCDPAEEPGVGGNPFCIEGHACCADGSWKCNDGGGNPICEKIGEVCEPTDPCAYFVQPGCVQTGCKSGYVCDTTVGCVPSACSCDPLTGDIICTADCSGGTCVPVSGETAIKGGGSSFGMCGGPCKTDLILDKSAAKLVTSGWDGTIYTTNSGELTAVGLQQPKTLAAALVGVNLQKVYGCPDCADGGASYVDLLRDGVASSHKYEFYNPPPELEDPDAFVFQVIEALLTCIPDTLVTPGPGCVPKT